MEQYRYSLEKGSRKSVCPDCNKKKFVRYIDTTNGGYIPEQYGRCDSEIDCAYYLSPYKDGYAEMIRQQEQGKNTNNWKPIRPQPKRQIMKPKREPAFIPVEVLEQTLTRYDQNVFLQNLVSRVSFPFEVIQVEEIISLYRLGTIRKGYRAGAITFPYIDLKGNVRAIQVKQFDEGNHTTGTDFLHSMIEKHYIKKQATLPEWLLAYQQNDLKVSCLFGEHLLSKYPLNPVALVEAPKTAIYGSLYFGFPDNPKNFLWLAVYNLSSINYEKCKELQGREVYLFPDLSKDGKAFDLWSTKAKELTKTIPGTTFKVSDLLERNAVNEQRNKGQDLADYLIEMDWREFRQPYVANAPNVAETKPYFFNNPKAPEAVPVTEPLPTTEQTEPPPPFDPVEYRRWFDGLPQLPSETFVQPGITVYNAAAFVAGRLNHIKAFEGYRDQGHRGLFIHHLNTFRSNVTDILNRIPA